MQNFFAKFLIAIQVLLGVVFPGVVIGAIDEGKEYDLIISECTAPQGNGSNWASTLGWMGERLRIRAEEAQKIENTGKKVGVYTNCMIGPSSGSVATMVYMGILSNPNLVAPSLSSFPVLTPGETFRVADAMQFMALTADLSLFELANMIFEYIQQKQIGRITNRISTKDNLLEFIRKVLKNKNPNWWGDQKVRPEFVLVDFIGKVRLAQTLTEELLYFDIKKIAGRNKKLKAAIHKYELKTISDFAEFSSLEGIKSLDEDEFAKLDELFKKVSRKMGNESLDHVRKSFRAFRFIDRYRIGTGPRASRSMLEMAESPVLPGFCTATMASLHKTREEITLEEAPDYNTLRPVVFCDEVTLRYIIESEKYRRDIQDPNSFANRFVLVSVVNVRSALFPSILEPNMMSERIVSMKTDYFDPISYYDPQADPMKLMHAKSANSFYMAVAGGWIDRRISAYIQQYFFAEAKEKLEAQAKEVRTYWSLFGKPDDRGTDKFDTGAIRNVFSPDSDPNENIEDWFKFQDHFCDFVEPWMDKNTQGSRIETVVLNWDLPGSTLPAAQARRSRILVAKSINATREQSLGAELRYVFDPLVKENQPHFNTAIPCRGN